MKTAKKTTESAKNCTICDTKMNGNYCHSCGQYYTGKKITFRELAGDFMAGIFSMERSVLATMWLIIRQPSIVIENYWQGWRGYYQSPGKLTVYATFIVGLHFALISNEFLGLNVQFTGVPPQIGLIILLIPLYSLASKLTFLKTKHSYLEHLISMIYLFSTWILVFVFLDIIQKYVLGNFLDEGMFILYMIVLFVWSARIHAAGSKWYKLLTYTVLELIVLMLIVTLILGSIYLIIPEAINVAGDT